MIETGSFEFARSDFERLQALTKFHTGIQIADHKNALLFGRLARRLRANGMTRFSDYCSLIESGDVDELEAFRNAVTTQHTKFFREQHHFELLQSESIRDHLKSALKQRGRLRFWSAGCSTGEEAYSMAAVLAHMFPSFERLDIKILATDINTDALNAAKMGFFDFREGEELPSAIKPWVTRSSVAEGRVKVKKPLRNMIRFNYLNLHGDWPFQGRFDGIFCRNVMIYFDQTTQEHCVNRLKAALQPRGILFIGHSETLARNSHDLALVGRTAYQRVCSENEVHR